jgi:two-component system nitrogen regulation response regulator GlnG
MVTNSSLFNQAHSAIFPNSQRLPDSARLHALTGVVERCAAGRYPIRSEKLRDRTVQALNSFFQAHEDLQKQGRNIQPYVRPIKEIFNALFGHDFFVPMNYDSYPIRRFFIVGETGTGKEALATICRNTLAQLCDESKGRNEAVSAAAYSGGTLESELFGHEKGAFTGASAKNEGLLKLVDGGVLFFDEIDKTERYLQTKLLRVLETGDFKAVGGAVTHKTRFHLVCASSTSLQALQSQTKALPDFLHRLSETVIESRTLRELLVGMNQPRQQIRFMQQVGECQMRSRGHPEDREGFDDVTAKRVVECMAGYSWPGNLRQLDRLIFKIALLGTERVEEICQKEREQWPDTTPPDAPQSTPQPQKYLRNPNPTSLKEELEACERYHYEMAFRNNRSFVDVAQALGVSRQTASRRLKELGIVVPS